MTEQISRSKWFVLGATLGLIALLLWTALSFARFREVVRDLATFEQASSEVRRLDEVLTMSAMMGAATGDLKWQERYDRHVPALDQAIEQAMSIGGANAKAAIAEVATSNQALIAMELEAFRLARSGQASAGLSILQSPRYTAQKLTYARGVHRALSAGRAHAHATERAAFMSLLLVSGVAIIASGAALYFWWRGRLEREAHSARLMLIAKDQQLGEVERANTAKSRFLATMSHELRTPLNAMIGYAELLEEDLGAGGDTQGAQYAERIRRAALNLLELINDVLDFSKIEAGRLGLHLAPCSVNAIVNDVVDLTRHLAAAHSNTVSVSLPDFPDLELDGGRVRQCLLNLVSNALKFTKMGEVHLAVSMTEADGDAFLQFQVADTGVGIAEDQLAALFEPFTQVDNSYTRSQQGTGLGLAITRRLARLMGGDVTVESVLGQGSRFTLRVAVAAGMHSTAPLSLVA